MFRVSYAIQTHRLRRHLAEPLAEKIGGDVDLVYDPEPDSFRKPWRTYRHLLELTPSWATHRFQIQDDTLPCRHLRETVSRCVEARPDRLLIFFVAGGVHHHAHTVLDACRRDEVWAELDYGHWCPTVATCWPASMIPDLLGFVDRQTHWPDRFGADDEIVGRFIRDAGIRPLATVPSLVEHPDNVDSLCGRKRADGRNPERNAACWIGDCADCDDPLLFDWS